MSAVSLTLPIPSPRRLWNSYNASLDKRPVLTKSLTSLVGFAIGDAVAQISSRPSDSDAPWRFDYFRTTRLATYGFAVAGPLGHHWFSFLDARVFPSAPKSIKAIASKIALDQSIMTPIGSALFFSFAKLMDAQPGAIIPTIQEKLVPTVKASIKLWPAAHAVNFAFIPSSQRLLYINIISIFWTTLLSKQASSGQEDVKVEAVASSPPQMVVVPVLEDEAESLASVSFLDEMEALEAEYDKS